ncbi:quercetin 2,3-dioxygenase [Aquabacterium fontiphilum]|jgi:redox-sensitive bicupin YhaK (pirin superfamily)|uniref:pirin family protein n=1 Tax=Aquabacterium fontiphilum TaxID=450365 RepID=UPI001377958A|nr:pirin family protein [Aquabacterium fontiphilum]NBD19656.1 quercetin 2,3-dioxygenase [Aquabacterium fontiphilum]
MMTLRRAEDRGHADHGWLQSHHSFSFAEYQDPAHVQFGPLRVINDDVIAPGAGFGMHGHRDMEIVTYVLQGAIAHKDSLGNGETVRPGEVQRMSAGKGILHSEFNPSLREPTRLLQIWIHPTETGLRPGYEQKAFAEADKRGRLRVVASPDGRDGSVRFHADAVMYAGLFDGEEAAELTLDPARKIYVHVAQGELVVNGERLRDGDALKLEGESRLTLGAGQQAEVLVFDLAA